jgi:acyl CoA:acetate/3-ketoacid CoA transferase alpha subunit/acyl CoA:acetate/3-ketoacid CoA transferase beta subunit
MGVANLIKTFGDIADIDLKQNEGKNKILGLEEAIRRYIKPGMSIYIREGSYAAIREMIRQFWGTQPEFILVMIGCRDYALDLLHCGLVAKVLTSRCSESATQGVSPVVKRAYKQKSIRIENWSLFSLTLRLMAGAMGIGFMPTRSILHSTMAQENRDSFIEMENPFDSGEKLGIIKSLNPDIAFVHGWASDPNGNLILAPAILSGEGEWGAFGSKQGIIATVEKIVSTEFIREHSFLVNIPGYFVESVSVIPFGAHPLGLATVSNHFEEYEADYEFMKHHGEASKETETLDAWLKEWVMACPNHEDYLKKLGYQRLAFLKGKAGQFNWEHKLLSLSEEILTKAEYNAEERMIIAASRIIKERVVEKEYRVILSGIGTAGLAAWLAYYQLKKAEVDVELMLGSSSFSWAPRPGDPQVTNFSNLRTCKMITDILHTYGIFAWKQCLSVLGSAQVDQYGNLNTTKLSEDSYLTGSGGANDAMAAARETIVVLAQSKRRFLDKLPYMTCFGKNVRTVISDKGIFEKIYPEEELILTGYFVDPHHSEQETIIRTIIEDCGWKLRVHPNLRKLEPPDIKELALLRLLSSKPDF